MAVKHLREVLQFGDSRGLAARYELKNLPPQLNLLHDAASHVNNRVHCFVRRQQVDGLEFQSAHFVTLQHRDRGHADDDHE